MHNRSTSFVDLLSWLWLQYGVTSTTQANIANLKYYDDMADNPGQAYSVHAVQWETFLIWQFDDFDKDCQV